MPTAGWERSVSGSAGGRVGRAAGGSRAGLRSRRALRTSGRRGRWRRGVLRRVVAAVLVGAAAWAATSTLAPDPPDPGTAVVVAAHDIPVGARLSDGDLRTVRMPDDVVPAGTFTDPGALTGEVANGPLRAGEPVTDLRVGLADTLAGLPDGSVLTHIPLTDAALAAALRPGTRVDVLSAADGSVLAGDILVTALSTPSRHTAELGLGSAADDAAASGFFAAVTEDEAARLAPATGQAGTLGGGVAVVLRRPETSG